MTRAAVVRSERYCIAPLVSRPDLVGLFRVGVFDDAMVFSVMPPAKHGVVSDVPGVAPTAMPDEVCLQLPHGCTCTEERCAPLKSALEGARRGVPRCRSDDPDCAPVAFGGVHKAAFRPGEPRMPVYPDPDGSRPEPCAFDGECLPRGYACRSVRTVDPLDTPLALGNGEEDRHLAGASCGCVEGQCAWFKQ